MGFTEVLTIVFIVLKVFGVITWSWWLVLLPEIIAVVLYITILILSLISVGKTHKRIMKEFKDF